jgi:hypothetical protein
VWSWLIFDVRQKKMVYVIATFALSVPVIFGGFLLFGSKKRLREIAAGIPKVFLPFEMTPDSKEEAAIFLLWRTIGVLALAFPVLVLVVALSRR